MIEERLAKLENTNAKNFEWDVGATEFVPGITMFERKAMELEDLLAVVCAKHQKIVEVCVEKIVEVPVVNDGYTEQDLKKAMETGIAMGQEGKIEILEAMESLKADFKGLGEKYMVAMEKVKEAEVKEVKLKELMAGYVTKNKTLQDQLLQREAQQNYPAKLKEMEEKLLDMQARNETLQAHFDPEVSDFTSSSDDHSNQEEEATEKAPHASAEQLAGRKVSRARFHWILDEWERNSQEPFTEEALMAAFDAGYLSDSCKKRVPETVKDEG